MRSPVKLSKVSVGAGLLSLIAGASVAAHRCRPIREATVEAAVPGVVAVEAEARPASPASPPPPAPAPTDRVVSAYETTFSLRGTGAERAANIRRAAAGIDGVVIAPGEVFSFNEVVGPRTTERGFMTAPEIQGDVVQLGYGGGTCQTSSTLHAAALFGALTIVERHAHSRPSSYTEMGLDATVSYPRADLKIKNTLPFPVTIRAFSPRVDAVRVEIRGGDPVARVEYAYDAGLAQSFGRRVEVRPGMRPGEHVLHQRGIPGSNVTSVVKVHFLDGREEQYRYFSGYRPAAEVYWMGPGASAANLPALFGG